MSLNWKKRIALICLIGILLAPFCGGLTVSEGEQNSFALPEETPAVSVAAVPEWTEGSEAQTPADRAALYVDGIRLGDCLLKDGSTYVSAEAFCKALRRGLKTEWSAETETLTVRCEGLEMTLRGGDNYFTANGRCFYVPGGIFVSGDGLVLPVRSLAAAFSLVPAWDGESMSVSVDTRELALPETADYDEEDLYWLSRIIHAESGNQSLEGMIAVGNVVLNRVANPGCPDTVYGVIFDRQYGVQFAPTVTGTIYEEPDEMSITAAKLCLEGVNVAGESLYFLNPAYGGSGWFARTRTYVTTIGQHDFYA